MDSMARIASRKIITFKILALAIFIVNLPSAYGQTQTKGLKDYYKDYFNIGASVSPNALKTDEAALLVNQFNSLTAENTMKMGPIHPSEKEYNWAGADAIVEFAQKNNLKMRGHTL